MKVFDPTLYLVSDNVGRVDGLRIIEEAVAGGVTMVQLRDKTNDRRNVIEFGLALVSLLRSRNIPLIVNDHPELVLSIGAQGVHLGKSDEKPSGARAILGRDAIIGYSVESVTELQNPELQYVDYIAASPVFPTSSKGDCGQPLLVDGLRRLREKYSRRLVAVGGITLGNVKELVEAGADGIAVVSAVFTAKNPTLAAERLKTSIDCARKGRLRPKPYRVLTIAGSDSGGGAGIQADLKTFQALGCYGMSAVTAITAQNTVDVRSVFPLPPQAVREQLEMVLEDIGADAIKIGMLVSAEIIKTVCEVLAKYKVSQVVLDPVMVAKSGAPLLEKCAIEVLRHELLPMASVITPNIPEAEIISGIEISNSEQMENAAASLRHDNQAVLIKGGHLETPAFVSDFLLSASGKGQWFHYPRVFSPNVHGTGCTYSAAIAAYVAQGYCSEMAVSLARTYLQGAIIGGAARTVGKGHGPVHHSWFERSI